MSKQENKEKREEGSGWLSSLLLAGGAAGVGFMAHKLWTDFQEQSSLLQQGPDSGPSHSPSDMTQRKKNRDKVFDPNTPQLMKCVVCFENPKEIMFENCGHVCICENCSEKMESKPCPMCMKPGPRRNAYIS